jgi:hypothetical protein
MYESIMNGVVVAENPRHAHEIVEAKAWLNYIDDLNEARGKIVPLFPTLIEPHGNVTRIEVVGVIPYVNQQADHFTQMTVSYAVAVLLEIDARSAREADVYLGSMRWFNPNAGLAYHGHSVPVPVGELYAKLR